MPPAARIGDMHACRYHGPTPIIRDGCPTVIIGGRVSAREGDVCDCHSAEDPIQRGEPTVLIGGKPAARISDPTDGGILTEGCMTVLIGLHANAACMTAAADASAGLVFRSR